MDHPINKFFDNVYVLYVTKKEYTTIKPRIEEEGLKVQYFKGVNGSERRGEYSRIKAEYNKNKTDSMYITIGGFGHTHSFIQIIEDAIKNRYNKILVLEADVYFSKQFRFDVQKYLKKKWSMLYLGAYQFKYFMENTWPLIESKNPDMTTKEYYRADKTLGTFALGLSSELFTPYLNALRTFKYTSDVQLVRLQDKYKGLVTYPNLVCCDLTESSTSVNRNQVEYMEHLRWFRGYRFTNRLSIPTERKKKYLLVVDVDSYLDPIGVEKDGEKLQTQIINDRLNISFVAKKSKTKFVFTNVFVKKWRLT